ncbi:hypothetical protein Tco_1125842 [Tanacetum coccineum]
MLAICNANEPVAFKALKTSSKTEKKDPKGQSLELHLDIGNNFQFLKTGNQNQPLASTLVVAGMHKEVHQATSSLASLGVTGHDASADSTIEADLGKSTPKDLLSQQQGNDEGTQNYSFGHIFAGTNPNVLVDKTQSAGDGLGNLTSFDDVTRVIKLEDLSKLVEDVNIDITVLDSPKDDQPFMVENDKDKEVHAEPNAKTEDTSLEKAQAEAALYEAQPSFPNVERLTELLELPSKMSDLNEAVRASNIMWKNWKLKFQVAKLKNLKLEVQVGLLDLSGQKEIEQLVKADVAKAEIKKGKEELIDLLGLEVVERMYKDKMKCDRYCNKMLNRRAQGKITNCDVLSRGKGPITLKMMVLMKSFRALRPVICTWGNRGK